MTPEHRPGHIVTTAALPRQFPTNAHTSEFWEALGRTVATFGFLEETLAKAIFALTATRPYSDTEVLKAYEGWIGTLQRALSDPLGNLIDVYAKSVREHPHANIANFTELEDDLRSASKTRNILCHGSWRHPDADGFSLPFYFNRKREAADTRMDVTHLARIQREVAKLSCDVVNSVTHMGFQFPGSGGPGVPIW